MILGLYATRTVRLTSPHVAPACVSKGSCAHATEYEGFLVSLWSALACTALRIRGCANGTTASCAWDALSSYDRRARASRLGPSTLTSSGTRPCTNFGSRWFLHARCCPPPLSGKATDVARCSALILPLPLHPDELSIAPSEPLEEHSRYATPSSLSTGWKCSLLVLGLHLSGIERATDPFELAIRLRLLVRDALSACRLLTLVNV